MTVIPISFWWDAMNTLLKTFPFQWHLVSYITIHKPTCFEHPPLPPPPPHLIRHPPLFSPWLITHDNSFIHSFIQSKFFWENSSSCTRWFKLLIPRTKSLTVPSQMTRAIEQHVSLVQFITLYKVVLFSVCHVDWIRQSDHSDESFWAVLSCGTVYYAVQGRCSFWVCGWNPKVWVFKWKLLSSSFLWYCLLCCTDKVVLRFESVYYILKCDHSNKVLLSETFLWCSIVSRLFTTFQSFNILKIL